MRSGEILNIEHRVIFSLQRLDIIDDIVATTMMMNTFSRYWAN